MTERARVTRIESDEVTVEATMEQCDTCSSALCGIRKRSFVVKNPELFPLQVGDTVQITARGSNAYIAAMWIFGVPIALFVAFYLGGGYFAGALGETGRSVFGVAGMAIGFGIGYLLARRRRQVEMPAISAVLVDQARGAR